MEVYIPERALIHVVERHASQKKEPWKKIVPKECLRKYREAAWDLVDEIERAQCCSEYEIWRRLVPQEFRKPLKEAIREQAKLGIDRPMYITFTEAEAKKKPVQKRSIVGPVGLQVQVRIKPALTAPRARQTLQTAFFPAESTRRFGWRVVGRSLLNRFCGSAAGFVVPKPGDRRSFNRTTQDANRRRVELYDIEIHTPETFGISRDRVTKRQRHTFPDWPEARKWEKT